MNLLNEFKSRGRGKERKRMGVTHQREGSKVNMLLMLLLEHLSHDDSDDSDFTRIKNTIQKESLTASLNDSHIPLPLCRFFFAVSHCIFHYHKLSDELKQLLIEFVEFSPTQPSPSFETTVSHLTWLRKTIAQLCGSLNSWSTNHKKPPWRISFYSQKTRKNMLCYSS